MSSATGTPQDDHNVRRRLHIHTVDAPRFDDLDLDLLIEAVE